MAAKGRVELHQGVADLGQRRELSMVRNFAVAVLLGLFDFFAVNLHACLRYSLLGADLHVKRLLAARLDIMILRGYDRLRLNLRVLR